MRRRSNEEEGWKKSELESQRRREIKEAEVAIVSFPRRKKRGEEFLFDFLDWQRKKQGSKSFGDNSDQRGILFPLLFYLLHPTDRERRPGQNSSTLRKRGRGGNLYAIPPNGLWFLAFEGEGGGRVLHRIRMKTLGRE